MNPDSIVTEMFSNILKNEILKASIYIISTKDYFSNCVCLNQLWVEYVADSARQEQYIKTTNAKNVIGNENKVILCDNVLKTT